MPPAASQGTIAATATNPAVKGAEAAQTASSGSESQLVDLAKADLASRLKLGTDKISLVSIAAITAADLTSGCTRKAGQLVMPDQTARGFQIRLAAEGHEYLYHAGPPDQAIACLNGLPGATHP
jgi:hypothetical protein